jgi:hypothetical protein
MMRGQTEKTFSGETRRHTTAVLAAQLYRRVNGIFFGTLPEVADEAVDQRFFAVKEDLMPSALR